MVTEKEVETVHENCARKLKETLEFLSSKEQELEEQLRQIRRSKKVLTDSVNAGRWWELKALLSEHEIEVLCSYEPYPCSSILDD